MKFEAKGRERGRGSWKGGSKLEGLGSTVHVLQCSAFCFVALVALCQKVVIDFGTLSADAFWMH